VNIMKKVDVAIIGAGVSGLSYANFCNTDYLIVEKDIVPGGLCKTFYYKDFVWDCAGHFFHFSDSEIKNFFESKIDAGEIVIAKKNTKIYYKGEYIDYPFQMNIHQLPKEEFIDCLYDLFTKQEKEEYENFEDMLYGKFGRGITEKFLKPYNEKLYACNLNVLDKNAMGRFFPYADKEEIVRNFRNHTYCSYNDSFEYPQRGAITFVNALLENVDQDKIMYGTKIRDIDLKQHILKTDKEEIQYNRLISSMPLNSFLMMNGLSQYKEVLKDLQANKVLVFNLGFDKKSRIDDVHWIYYPSKDINFYRVGFYDNILKTGKLSLYVEIGYKLDEEINIDVELEKTISNLKECGIISDHKLIGYNSIVIPSAYVHITERVKKEVSWVLKQLEKQEVYKLGRYGRWTYCSIEDCIKEAKRLAVQNR